MQQSIAGQSGLAFRLKKRFDAPREKVFGAWTQPEILKRWWCPAGWEAAEIEVDLRVGGAFRIGMRRRSGGLPVYVTGSFLTVHSPETLVYTWKWENAFENMPQTRVTVVFRDLGTTTEVVLTHDGLLEIPFCLQVRSGWIEAWSRLVDALAG